MLLLSEPGTNSVRHAAAASPRITVTYAASDDMLAFAVHDRHPYARDPLSFPQSTGGLAIVAGLATEWGGTWTGTAERGRRHQGRTDTCRCGLAPLIPQAKRVRDGTMTIQWRYTTEAGLGILSPAGRLGAQDTVPFAGAITWVLARGAGPAVVDLTVFEGWMMAPPLPVHPDLDTAMAAHPSAGAPGALQWCTAG